MGPGELTGAHCRAAGGDVALAEGPLAIEGLCAAVTGCSVEAASLGGLAQPSCKGEDACLPGEVRISTIGVAPLLALMIDPASCGAGSCMVRDGDGEDCLSMAG